MADPFATHADVEARWRPLSADEQAVADQLLADASDMIRERWSDVDARVTAGSLTAETLRRIVSQMVKRAMLASEGEGLESRSQTAGPYAESVKYANPTGALYFTNADVLLLDGAGFSSQARVGWLA